MWNGLMKSNTCRTVHCQ